MKNEINTTLEHICRVNLMAIFQMTTNFHLNNTRAISAVFFLFVNFYRIEIDRMTKCSNPISFTFTPNESFLLFIDGGWARIGGVVVVFGYHKRGYRSRFIFFFIFLCCTNSDDTRRHFYPYLDELKQEIV